MIWTESAVGWTVLLASVWIGPGPKIHGPDDPAHFWIYL